MIPMDNYFTSGWKSGKSRPEEKMAAVHKRSWPQHYCRKAKLEMKPGPRGVEGRWAFLDVEEGSGG